MITRKNFGKPLFVEQISRELLDERYEGDETLLPAVQKGIFHDGLLFALHQSGLLARLIFHGGTALQRFYGNHRLSEDLDFVCDGMESEAFLALCSNFEEVVRDVLHDKFRITDDHISVVSPQMMPIREEFGAVQTWKIKIDVGYMQKRQIIKIDIENGRAITHGDKAFQPLSPKLPLSPFLMKVKSAEEILADKVLALAMRNRVQPRDIYDFIFLAEVQKISVNVEMLKEKTLARGIAEDAEASITISDRMAALQTPNDAMADDFLSDLRRFLPDTTIASLQDHDKTKDMYVKAASGLAQYIAVLKGIKRSSAT